MIDKIIEKVSKEINLEHKFHAPSLTLFTTTWIGSAKVHTHSFDLTPMYEEFCDRFERENTEQD
jgi:hypothetical protein